MADLKKALFPTPPILKIFLWKFHGLVLGLVGLIDAKGIDLAQTIWWWDCLIASSFSYHQFQDTVILYLLHYFGYFLGGGIDHCTLHNRHWYNVLNIKAGSEFCGGNGGNGGNGGPGGPAGFLKIDGPTDIKPQNTRLSSQGKYTQLVPEKLF